jgi:drug/metabolite transporter (DMT)-like permease
MAGHPTGIVLPDAGAVLEAIATGVADQVGATVKPEAVTAMATTFSFPLLLMFAVLLFLFMQGRLDGQDPKLRNAPLTGAETTVMFGNEVELR